MCIPYTKDVTNLHPSSPLWWSTTTKIQIIFSFNLHRYIKAHGSHHLPLPVSPQTWSVYAQKNLAVRCERRTWKPKQYHSPVTGNMMSKTIERMWWGRETISFVSWLNHSWIQRIGLNFSSLWTPYIVDPSCWCNIMPWKHIILRNINKITSLDTIRYIYNDFHSICMFPKKLVVFTCQDYYFHS